MAEEGDVNVRYGERPHAPRHERDSEYHRGIHGSRSGEGGRRGRGEREEREREDRRVAERGERVPSNVPLDKGVLTVLSHDLHLAENTKEHHTDHYDCTERDFNPRLVVRRGQLFMMTFTFQRPWVGRADDFFMLFTVGPNPSKEEGTFVLLMMDENRTGDMQPGMGGWSAKIGRTDGNQLTVLVYPSPDTVVGEWECAVATRLTKTREVFVYQSISDIYVIFNPWCPADQVYYDGDPADLEEYVLNEYGCVYTGQPYNVRDKPWFYGQFRDEILDTCMTILSLGFDTNFIREMGDVVTVTRKLSRILNHSSADPGVMAGNWSGDYSGGTPPLKWRSSANILWQFARTKKPVKYAQCWVFSHVLTTVCRALGIPCRSLTNFDSAHDTDKTMTIDKYKDISGEDLPEMNSDSIWNFHCWNDVWIQRPDIDRHSDKLYSGWHAVDATPQERSQGRFQCGPTPHTAIKHGELSIGHDTGFIFGEVNGELCTWMVSSSGKRMELMSKDPHAVGKAMSTKKPEGARPAGRDPIWDKNTRLDITHLYKFPEGSKEERIAVKAAVGKEMAAAIFEAPMGVTFEIQPVPETMVGSSFTFKVLIKSNEKKQSKRYKLTMAVNPCDYRGERIGWDSIVLKKFETAVIAAGASVTQEVTVTDKAYLSKCDKSMSMMLSAYGRVEGEETPISKNVSLVLTAPPLDMQVVGRTSVFQRGKPFTVNILVTNPCSKPLTGCELELDGSIDPVASENFTKEDGTFIRKIRKEMFPNQQTMIRIDVQAQDKPLRFPQRQLIAEFTCNELPEMTGMLKIDLESGW